MFMKEGCSIKYKGLKKKMPNQVQYIQVRWECKQCGVQNQLTKVRARRPDEDVIQWFECILTRAVWEAHTVKSMFCGATSLDRILLPLPEDGEPNPYIGKYTSRIPVTFEEVDKNE